MHNGGVDMYLKDKNIRLTLRLSPEQFAFVKESSDALAMSPSEFLRMIITYVMTAESEGKRRENEQTHFNDKL